MFSKGMLRLVLRLNNNDNNDNDIVITMLFSVAPSSTFRLAMVMITLLTCRISLTARDALY